MAINDKRTGVIDQIAKLQEAQDKALSELAVEANPESWPKGDTQQGRGDRLWMKKNAIATAELIETLGRVIGAARQTLPVRDYQSVDPKVRKDADELLKKHRKVTHALN